MVLSSNTSSEDTDKILAAVIVAVLHKRLLQILLVVTVVQGGKSKGWQLAELAAARFARACLSASELAVHWVTLRFRKQREQ